MKRSSSQRELAFPCIIWNIFSQDMQKAIKLQEVASSEILLLKLCNNHDIIGDSRDSLPFHAYEYYASSNPFESVTWYPIYFEFNIYLLQIDEETLEQALSAAVVCCILAAAGPQRSRMLATLYKDERIGRLPSFGFLEKVFFERILRKHEVKLYRIPFSALLYSYLTLKHDHILLFSMISICLGPFALMSHFEAHFEHH